MIMDAIASQYGWDYETILDLYLGRVNQVKDAIFIRQYYEMKTRHREIEWQTKTVASFIIATAQGSEDGKKSLQRVLEGISLSDTNNDKVPVPQSTKSTERTLEDIIENGSTEEALLRNEGKNLSDLFAV